MASKPAAGLAIISLSGLCCVPSHSLHLPSFIVTITSERVRGDKTKPGPLSDIVILLMIHLKTKVEISCVSRSQCGLSESCHRRVSRVLTCDQFSCVPCTLLSRLYLISCVLYLGCLHQASGRAGGSMTTMKNIVSQMHTSDSRKD